MYNTLVDVKKGKNMGMQTRYLKNQDIEVESAIENLKKMRKALNHGEGWNYRRYLIYRDFLVNHYSYMLKDLVYDEDLLQDGYIILIELIDIFSDKRLMDLEGFLQRRLAKLMAKDETLDCLSLDEIKDNIADGIWQERQYFVTDEGWSLEEMVEEKFFNENVLQVLDILDDRERRYIEIRFGIPKQGASFSSEAKSLRECTRYFDMTHESLRNFESKILKKIQRYWGLDESKEKVKTPTKPFKDDGKTLLEILLCSVKELHATLFYFDKSGFNYQILRDAFGYDLAGKQNIQVLDNAKRKVFYTTRDKLQQVLQKIRNREGKLLQEILGLSEQEFERFWIFIDLDNDGYKGLLQGHGFLFKNRFRLENLSFEDIDIYQRYLTSLKRQSKRLVMPTIYSYFFSGKYKHLIIPYIMSQPEMYKVMSIVYGDDLLGFEDTSRLSDSLKSMYYYYLYQIKAFLLELKGKRKEEVVEIEGECIVDNSHPFFAEIIHLMPVSLKEKEMLARSLGIFDGKKYSLQELSYIYHMSYDNTLKEITFSYEIFQNLCCGYSLTDSSLALKRKK